MDFEGIVTSIVKQIAVVGQSPVPFIVCVLLACMAIWRALEWKHRATIDGLNHRIALRDDTIRHFEKDGPKTARAATPSSELSQSKVTPVRNGAKERAFLSHTQDPDFLHNLYRDRTTIQADKLAAIYVGKWMKVRGIVNNVMELSPNETSVSIIPPSDVSKPIPNSLSLTVLFFEGDKERLELLCAGDEMSAIGKIKRISMADLSLVEGELIKAE